VTDPSLLPANLPVPVDDGAAAHLPGLLLPTIELPATTGTAVTLDGLGAFPPDGHAADVLAWLRAHPRG
jgi:hypothetical protein